MLGEGGRKGARGWEEPSPPSGDKRHGEVQKRKLWSESPTLWGPTRAECQRVTNTRVAALGCLMLSK